MDGRVDLTIRPLWEMVRKLRLQVDAELANYPRDLRSAASMTASELVENSIKYGESVEDAPYIRFSMKIEDGTISIRTVNGCMDDAGVALLMSRVEETSHTADRAALYIARLEQLAENPSGSAKLGVYRIALEGGFDLACTYENHVVTVIASRSVT